MGQETGETQEEVRATRAGIHSELGEIRVFCKFNLKIHCQTSGSAVKTPNSTISV